ncbi:DeoR/GlpR family DNA-binding transcription regulator [Shouchella shacheensis]|uniref:DeoR/GlpR family DNA-binding transcription regulator n=1 Tax=Shouchella shacheensis TaxID=1649580 RepID=UPI0009E92E00|nr:DeoR/GlpR family DNA-binding transcription regulator [Shouchella shacheensis]
MYQEERLVKILDYLDRHSTISNQNICTLLNVSRDTARRDIIKLVEEGAAIRTHGGIASPSYKEEIKAYKEKAYKERLTTASKQKLAIAQAAFAYVQDDDLCFLDVSTTVQFLCESLKGPLTVYTHSLDNAEVLSTKKEITVHLLGGKLNHNNRFFHDFTLSSQQLGAIYFDKAFFGAAGVSEDGVYFVNREDASIKQIIAKRARKVFLLTDAQKFHQPSHYKGFSFKDIDTLIMNEAPSDKYKDLLKQNNVTIELTHSNE